MTDQRETDRQPALTDTRTSTAPGITETVRVGRMETRATYLGKELADWDWADLRNYVVRHIEDRLGPIPNREPRKEYGVFNSFLNRWNALVPGLAPAIAEAAFEIFGGMWESAPIREWHFYKKSDPFFAQVIAERLAD